MMSSRITLPIVATTAAALLRVTTESSTPMLTTAASGIRYRAFEAAISASASPAETTVPDRLTTWWKPHETTPATVATVADRNTARAA